MTNYARRIEEKIRAAKRGGAPSKPSGDARIPPGQHVVADFPVLDLGVLPRIEPRDWRLGILGLVEKEVSLDWEQFLGLPQVGAVSDFHCVTHWTRFDLHWEGVRAADVLALARPLPNARFATLHAYDDYTTNLASQVLYGHDVLIAHRVLGAPLPAAHGGPVRLVVPSRYGWKSAKWLKSIELHAEDRPGYWETRGYHNEADPWNEERFGGGPA